jgi:mannose-1-phosphate guanylyltransferase
LHLRSSSSLPQFGQVRIVRSGDSAAGSELPAGGAAAFAGSIARFSDSRGMRRLYGNCYTALPVTLTALVLAGGSGTRFWPMSRRDRPKQLLTLEGERSLLRATVERLAPLVPPERVWVSTTTELGPAVAAELPEIPAEQVLCEPAGRNTAPAIAWSLSRMRPEQRAGAVAVLPSDHRIGDPGRFRAVLARAAEAALEEDRILALGVEPRWAETGFGYLELADGTGPGGLRRVAHFREKPDRTTAESFFASGRHLWNAGMFVFRGDGLLARLAAVAPELAAALARLAAEPRRLAELYPALPSISIDYAVMEKLDELWTLPLDCGWDDLGSWQALFEVLPADAQGNRSRGDVLSVDARDNLLVADRGTIAVLGIDDLVVVRTGDTVLVVPRDRAQEVRVLVERLVAARRDDLL